MLASFKRRRTESTGAVGHQNLDRCPELAVFDTSDHDRPWPSPAVTSACAGPRPAPTLSADRDGQGHRIMVLRHQVLILERQLNVRVAYRPVDRAILAALSRLLARWRWRSFLVTPEKLLRWHRELSRRKWRRWRSTRGPGRPPINDELVELDRKS